MLIRRTHSPGEPRCCTPSEIHVHHLNYGAQVPDRAPESPWLGPATLPHVTRQICELEQLTHVFPRINCDTVPRSHLFHARFVVNLAHVHPKHLAPILAALSNDISPLPGGPFHQLTQRKS